MTEIRPNGDKWDIYVDGTLVEGGFFRRRAAEIVATHDYGYVKTFPANALVAIMADDNKAVTCIGRIVSDDGVSVVVRSDEQLERETAHEYGFAELPARMVRADRARVRPIKPRVN